MVTIGRRKSAEEISTLIVLVAVFRDSVGRNGRGEAVRDLLLSVRQVVTSGVVGKGEGLKIYIGAI